MSGPRAQTLRPGPVSGPYVLAQGLWASCCRLRCPGCPATLRLGPICVMWGPSVRHPVHVTPMWLVALFDLAVLTLCTAVVPLTLWAWPLTLMPLLS